MKETASHYFARGNTARGAHFLYESAYQGLNRLFVLQGPSGTGKSTIIRGLADSLLERGLHVQCFHSPLRPDELDGIIATDLRVGIIDEQASGGVSGIEAGETIFFDFVDALDLSRLSAEQRNMLDELHKRFPAAYSEALEGYGAALRIHDDWEKYYIESLDFAKCDQIVWELMEDLFAGQPQGAPGVTRHLFFGAATPKGAFDFIPDLTASLRRRIFIKGRPGSGKSTMLKKLAAGAEMNGVQVQVFHCGLDPHSLDMLIFPELSTAIFDSTAPHEYFPEREGDEILDVYERAMTPGTDETYADELAAIKSLYSAKMKEATGHLAEAEAIDAQLKALHTAATDFSIVDGLRSQLFAELEHSLAEVSDK
ncbi:hypothetical protein [Paenibacillus soyae]|uniref:NACHT domain-containing protein n=1 Tax=Paenibacillus soyae TaxID=2969249 RepID=A0A9X2MW28_9BACL|nr:hypothetical protein [Paenibacillus soyae]MCR2807389.1 hypothetical protein [Paenibacillus soyae]